MGGMQTSITFQVGSSVQSYDVADVRSLRFDSEAQGASPSIPSKQPSVPSSPEKESEVAKLSSVTIPAGTRISVRTIDSIDSTRESRGISLSGFARRTLVARRQSGGSEGRRCLWPAGCSPKRPELSLEGLQLRLQLTGIVVNGQTVPLVTGEYEVSGKSKGESTAKRTVGGAAIGSLIGALAGGGKGAAIGAGSWPGRAWEPPLELSRRVTRLRSRARPYWISLSNRA